MTQPTFLRYWGKARPSRPEGASSHLLPYHCLDVAAVGRLYLGRHRRLLAFLAEALSLPEAVVLDWIAFWLAVHDIGKFAEPFQAQRQDLFLELQGEPPRKCNYSVPHDVLGALLWNKSLASELSAAGESWVRWYEHGIEHWVHAVTGHHGKPPAVDGQQALPLHFSQRDLRAALEFVRTARGLLLPQAALRALAQLDRREFLAASKKLSWWVAGLAVLADWIGSNTDCFPYRADPLELDAYWALAQEQARWALAITGVLPAQPAATQAIEQLFPYVADPTPLQRWAANAPIFDAPALYVLEDVTGAGKTEAAITLAHRLLAHGRADGLFFALPTMATANAMFRRLAPMGARLFELPPPPSIVLAHGQRHLSPEFDAAVVPAGAPEDDPAQHDASASARCAAWLADSNKKALLAHVGVGTIDQALLAVLHARHQSLRLLGLFGKVLVVDEVHACDAYVLNLLGNVLRFHAASGGSAILLSATLPKATKQVLVDAFTQGLRGREARGPAVVSNAYPLATSCCPAQGHFSEESVASRAVLARRVAVSGAPSVEDVVAHLVAAAHSGRCAIWIRNTIHDALAAHALLALHLPPERLLLFHARFAMGDRLNIEAELERRFGERSGAEDRAGHVVIATQVAEQSLDVDFDVMATDLAPVDRLVQRAGRLHRHLRDVQGNRIQAGPDGRGQPQLLIHAPQWTEDPDASWFQAVFPKAAKVYPDHALLWRSLREIAPGYRLPEDGRSLVEAAYAGEPPPGLQQNAYKAEGEARASAGIAHDNGLKFESGYSVGTVSNWWSDAITPSRLGEATVTARLAKWDGSALVPWCAGEHAWDMSSVRVPQRLFKAEAPLPEPVAVQAERLKQTWPDRGQWSALLVLSPGSDGSCEGKALNQRDEVEVWRYDAQLGLRLCR